MPTKVELMKQLKKSQEESRDNWMACLEATKKLVELQINFNRIIDLIKGCDSEQKLDMLKELGHIPIIIDQIKK